MAISKKAEIITNNDLQNENALKMVDNTGIVDVQNSLEAWGNYQELCTKLLNDSDYQLYKDKDGKTKRFPKKSAWFKLGKAFNVNTEIIESTVYRAKNGQVREAYYKVRAWIGNRSVEADASCDVWEKGKAKSSGHDLRTTAETRATNRAISKLIGAGEVSAEEINNEDLKKVREDKSL